jgi:hypothetical protein
VKRILGVIVILAVLVASFLVWPTRWRYDHITVDGDTYIVRIDRLSGHADILVPESGWTPAEDSWDNDSTPPTDQHT